MRNLAPLVCALLVLATMMPATARPYPSPFTVLVPLTVRNLDPSVGLWIHCSLYRQGYGADERENPVRVQLTRAPGGLQQFAGTLAVPIKLPAESGQRMICFWVAAKANDSAGDVIRYLPDRRSHNPTWDLIDYDRSTPVVDFTLP